MKLEHMAEKCEQHLWDGTISFATLSTHFPVKWAAGAFVLFIDGNLSFAALNLATDRAQFQLTCQTNPSDTSFMCLSLADDFFSLSFKIQTAN